MLGHMTEQWAFVAVGISQYILKKRLESRQITEKNLITIYNCWLQEYGCNIDDPELAKWALSHIKNMLAMPLQMLQTIVQEDSKRFFIK